MIISYGSVSTGETQIPYMCKHALPNKSDSEMLETKKPTVWKTTHRKSETKVSGTKNLQ